MAEDPVVPLYGSLHGRKKRFTERRFRQNRTEQAMIFEQCKLLAAEIQERERKKK